MDIILNIIEQEKNKRGLTNYKLWQMSGVSQSYLSYLFSGKRKLGNTVKYKLLNALGIDLELQKKERTQEIMRIKGNYHRILRDFLNNNLTEIEKEQYTDELREFCSERNYPYENTTYTNSLSSAFYCYLSEMVKINPKATTHNIRKPADFPDFSFDMYCVESYGADNTDHILTTCGDYREELETILKHCINLDRETTDFLNRKLDKLNKVSLRNIPF